MCTQVKRVYNLGWDNLRFDADYKKALFALIQVILVKLRH